MSPFSNTAMESDFYFEEIVSQWFVNAKSWRDRKMTCKEERMNFEICLVVVVVSALECFR